MNRQAIFEYYNRDTILASLIATAQEREFVGAYADGRYDARPNMVQYPADILQLVKKGVTSFHASVERWRNPMAITHENYKQLRTGWDLVIDIDAKFDFDDAKDAALCVIELLKRFGIKNINIKFSGRRGFHIVVPWEMFPKTVNFRELKDQYPLVPRILARFVCREIEEELMKRLVKKKTAQRLVSQLQEKPNTLTPFLFLDIEKDWGNRHVFRAPYSLNEKTWLVSLPLKEREIEHFDPQQASPDRINDTVPFFLYEPEEATSLMSEALDWHTATKKQNVQTQKPKQNVSFEKKIDAAYFPPCMKLILNGLEDGRKRSVFTIVSFLRRMNWTWDEIEAEIMQWNERNKTPLPRTILLSQLRWSKMNERHPANCFNDLFYVSFGVCQPDETCKRIKNPIAYPLKKLKVQKIEKEPVYYACSVCKKAFSTMRSLNVHLSRMHDIVS